MPTQTVTINGHQYVQTTDASGNIISQIGTDPFPVISRPLSKYQFRQLFTQAERVAMDNYATNTALTAAQQAVMRTLTLDFQIADSIDLHNAETIQGVNLLESYGLIASGRAAQVLANQPPPSS